MRLSVLDRLIQNKGPDPDAGRGDEALSEPSRAERWKDSVEEYKARVLRDLEWLLNTRETGEPAEAPWTEVERSIYNYGLPDFASMFADSAHTSSRLLKAIEREIELFEPRLTNVRVSVQDAKEGEERSLRFVIEATMLLDPDPEHVEFDSVLEIDSGHFSLKHQL